jgi:hypothetical protein
MTCARTCGAGRRAILTATGGLRCDTLFLFVFLVNLESGMKNVYDVHVAVLFAREAPKSVTRSLYIVQALHVIPLHHSGANSSTREKATTPIRRWPPT